MHRTAWLRAWYKIWKEIPLKGFLIGMFWSVPWFCWVMIRDPNPKGVINI